MYGEESLTEEEEDHKSTNGSKFLVYLTNLVLYLLDLVSMNPRRTSST